MPWSPGALESWSPGAGALVPAVRTRASRRRSTQYYIPPPSCTSYSVCDIVTSPGLSLSPVPCAGAETSRVALDGVPPHRPGTPRDISLFPWPKRTSLSPPSSLIYLCASPGLKRSHVRSSHIQQEASLTLLSSSSICQPDVVLRHSTCVAALSSAHHHRPVSSHNPHNLSKLPVTPTVASPHSSGLAGSLETAPPKLSPPWLPTSSTLPSPRAGTAGKINTLALTMR